MEEFIHIYSTALLTNHVANKEKLPKKEITDEDINELTNEREKVIEGEKTNRDLMKIHLKVLEEFEKSNKQETIIKKIREFEAIQSANDELKNKVTYLENENFDKKIKTAQEENTSLKREIEILEKKLVAQKEAKKIASSKSKTQKILEAFE